jgi:hypothetical protein
MPEFLRAYKDLCLPINRKYFGPELGLYVTEVGTQSQFIHLWQYADMADYEQKRKARDADPDWPAYLKATEGLLISQETKLIRKIN